MLDFGEEDTPPKPPVKYKHPGVCFAHLFFRSSALITYLLCGILGVGFVTSFIIIILLLSADFWCVKNVTGRLLVGLRWINRIKEDGTSVWEYESRKDPSRAATAFESRLFWISLIVFPLIWVFLLFSTIFGLKLQWLAVVLVALVLNGANLFGYVRCKFSSGKEMGSAASKYFGGKIFSTLRSNPDLIVAAAATPATAAS